MCQDEIASFRMSVLTNRKSRGAEDSLVTNTDDPKNYFPLKYHQQSLVILLIIRLFVISSCVETELQPIQFVFSNSFYYFGFMTVQATFISLS